MSRTMRIPLDGRASVSPPLCVGAVVLWMWCQFAGRGIFGGRMDHGSYQFLTLSRGELSFFEEHGLQSSVVLPGSGSHWTWSITADVDLLTHAAFVALTARPPVVGFFFGRAGGMVRVGRWSS